VMCFLLSQNSLYFSQGLVHVLLSRVISNVPTTATFLVTYFCSDGP
jgi:Na+/H+ antiporter NhaD/arsenite permease-like protein